MAMIVTVQIPLTEADVRALRRSVKDGPMAEISIQEIAERLGIAAVQLAVRRGAKVEETHAKGANGELEAGVAQEAFASVGGNTGDGLVPSTAVVSPTHEPAGHAGEAGARTEGAPRRRSR